MPSNFNGEFHFTLIPDASYTIYYDAVGYEPKVQSGIVVSGGGPVTATTVTLYREGEQPSSGSGGSTQTPAPPQGSTPLPPVSGGQEIKPSPTPLYPYVKKATVDQRASTLAPALVYWIKATVRFVFHEAYTYTMSDVFIHNTNFESFRKIAEPDVGVSSEVFVSRTKGFLMNPISPGVNIIGAEDFGVFKFRLAIRSTVGRPYVVKIETHPRARYARGWVVPLKRFDTWFYVYPD